MLLFGNKTYLTATVFSTSEHLQETRTKYFCRFVIQRVTFSIYWVQIFFASKLIIAETIREYCLKTLIQMTLLHSGSRKVRTISRLLIMGKGTRTSKLNLQLSGHGQRLYYDSLPAPEKCIPTAQRRCRLRSTDLRPRYKIRRSKLTQSPQCPSPFAK